MWSRAGIEEVVCETANDGARSGIITNMSSVNDYHWFELCNLISFKEFHCVNMFTCLFFLEKKLFFRFTIVQKKIIFLSP